MPDVGISWYYLSNRYNTTDVVPGDCHGCLCSLAITYRQMLLLIVPYYISFLPK